MHSRYWDGSGAEVKRIDQPSLVLEGKKAATRRFPDPWTLLTNQRLGEDYLEIYEVGDSVPIRSLPFFWHQKGQDMDLNYDLWFARDQLSLDADDVRLSAYAFGADNALGQEIVQNGYLKAKLATAGTFEPLSPGTFLSLGFMKANSKQTLNLRLNIPLGAASQGFIILGLKIQALRSAFYGTLSHGISFYGAAEKLSLDTLTAKIHIFART